MMASYDLGGASPTLAGDGSNWIAPSADMIGDVRLGRATTVWFGAVIRADNTQIVIGDNTNVQDGAMLHSDPGSPLSVGDNCTIGHHAVLHGCTIGNATLVGMGATILNGAVIGDSCLIGARALITEYKTFPDGSLIVGSPAKVIRMLNEEEIAGLRASAAGYAERGRLYAAHLNPCPLQIDDPCPMPPGG